MKTKNLLYLAFLIVLQSPLYAQSIGEPDSSFGGDGIVVSDFSFDTYNEWLRGLAVQDNKIIAAGFTVYDSQNDILVVRYNEDGTIDGSFDLDGKLMMDLGTDNDVISDVIIKEDGKILLGGYTGHFYNSDFLVMQLNSDGSIDTDFGTDNGFTVFDAGGDDVISKLVIDREGRILAAGRIDEEITDYVILRFTDNGVPDTSFGTDGYCRITGFDDPNNELRDLIELSDHKIAACGRRTSIGTFRIIVMRLNENGTLDTTFSNDGIDIPDFGTPHEEAACLTEQEDGKLLVCGNSHTVISDMDFSFISYDHNGNLDSAFGIGGKIDVDICGDDEYMMSMVIQPDGKMVFGARAVNSGNYDFMITRFNEDLTLDEDFGDAGKTITPIGDSFDFAQETILQADGKILLGGSTQNGTMDFAILRYNSGLEIDEIQNSPLDNIPLIFPNPTSGDVSIDGGKFKEETNIEIYNTLGELKYRNSFAPDQHINFTIDGDADMYIVLMRAGKYIYRTAIIKE